MSNNAMWWVRGVDQNGGYLFMSLMSADLKDPRKATKRARDTARQRWAKKGVKAKGLSVQCVG